MVIVYESKTGFTKKYAEMLAEKTGMKLFRVDELSKIDPGEEILFLGWMKIGKIQGLDKLKKHNVTAVCGSGTGRTAEPDTETILARNKIGGIPFFYLRGGCLPLKKLKGLDRIKLSLFLRMLKTRKVKDERIEEAITIIQYGFDGVKEENLIPVLAWIDTK